MRTLRIVGFGLLLAVAAGFGPAKAQQFSSTSGGGLFGIFDEVRAGGSFSVQPNDDSGFIVRGELLFRPFFPMTDNYVANTVFNPRLHVGGNLATKKDGVSQVFTGLTWNFPVYRALFVEATFGFTVHDGPLESPGDGLDLGCRLLFREGIGVGMDLGQHLRVVAAADHSSHGHLICDNDAGNSGITHVGAYLGYRF